MFVINYRSIFISLSVALVALAITAVAVFGLPLGIDFKGGSALEVTYTSPRPTLATLHSDLATAGFQDAVVQLAGDTDVTVKSRTLTEDERAQIFTAITENGTLDATQTSFTSIGPSVGMQLKHKAFTIVILVLLAIICFVAYAFRNVSKPLSSWKYGLAVIIALVHDIAIPLGAFALLAHFRGVELDTLFVVAVLTTLALSVADTIVVFDRIRENLKVEGYNPGKKSFDRVVGESLSQTFVRSINTSLVVLFMVITLAIVGPASTKLFATVLAIGMFFGTYSSIFLASPLLVVMERAQKGKK